MSELPPGFDGVYRCRRHPERPVVAPIACRRCQECSDEARHNYAAMIERETPWLASQDTTTWGEKLDERRVKKRKVELI